MGTVPVSILILIVKTQGLVGFMQVEVQNSMCFNYCAIFHFTYPLILHCKTYGNKTTLELFAFVLAKT